MKNKKSKIRNKNRKTKRRDTKYEIRHTNHSVLSTRNSRKLFQQAQEVMVGGVNSPVRSFRSVGGDPLIMQKGKGARFTDIDGNSYTDYCLSWGALILGHAHKDVGDAVRRTVVSGTSFGTSTKPEIEIARHIVSCVPSVEMIRFVNSGTEATMSAIRLARGFTKKNLLVKFDGCYHGHFDDLLVTAGSGVAHLNESSSLGITPSHVHNTISLPFNDTALLTETLETRHQEIACVIVEPVPGNMGVVTPEKDFLKALRHLTHKYNIVMIFDEIMSGFRTGSGCVQSEMDVLPDITCLGKIIGGGFPIGAYGGRKDIMRHLAPLGGVYQAGTFSGNPVVLSAGLTVLKNLNREFYRDLNDKCAVFSADLNTFFVNHNIPARLSAYHSMMSLRFSSHPVKNYQDAQKASSQKVYTRLFHHLLNAGIYLPPADLEAFFVSGAHTVGDLVCLAEEVKKFFRQEEHHS